MIMASRGCPQSVAACRRVEEVSDCIGGDSAYPLGERHRFVLLDGERVGDGRLDLIDEFLWGEATMLETSGSFVSVPTACYDCGMFHQGVCHRIAAIEYHPDGTRRRVEYVTPAPAPAFAANPLPAQTEIQRKIDRFLAAACPMWADGKRTWRDWLADLLAVVFEKTCGFSGLEANCDNCDWVWYVARDLWRYVDRNIATSWNLDASIPHHGVEGMCWPMCEALFRDVVEYAVGVRSPGPG